MMTGVTDAESRALLCVDGAEGILKPAREVRELLEFSLEAADNTLAAVVADCLWVYSSIFLSLLTCSACICHSYDSSVE